MTASRLNRLNPAFTLIELLVVISIIGILGALLLPALATAREQSRKTACLANLGQVNLAIRLYTEDFSDSWPTLPTPNPYPNGVGAYYKELVKSYLQLSGPSDRPDRIFICPSDRSVYKQPNHDSTSYTFNGYEVSSNELPRITGQKPESIRNPTRGVVVGEVTAFFGGAFHPSTPVNTRDAKSEIAFVDGHASFVKIYWNGAKFSQPRNYEPPESYSYRWDGQ
jgi:prepilin-type N-terminal cleavage/methylation domain-containing protein